MVTTKEFSIVIQFCLLISFVLPIVKGCEIGYFGRLCDEKCRFPNYGLRCQLPCNCSEKDCHHINGCGNFSSEKSSVIPQTVEYGSINESPDKERSKAEDNFNTTAKTIKTRKIKKRTATKRPFLFAIIGLAAIALLLTASYTYITLCNDQRKGPNKIELIV